MNEAESVAAWLAAVMTERRMSQQDLAMACGVSKSTISRIVRRLSAPRPEVVAQLARYFGADAHALLTQNGLIALDAPPEARAEAAELVRRLYALPAADRQDILRQINPILDFLEGASGADADAGAGE